MYPNLPPRSRCRACRFLAVEDADLRRRTQLISMCRRMESARDSALEDGGAAEVTATIFDVQAALALRAEVGGSDDPVTEQTELWWAIENTTRRRKVAKGTELMLHKLWRLPTRRHATCVANSSFDRCPKN